MAAVGCYLHEDDISNWPAGYTEAQKQAIIDKVEQIIDKVTHTHWCATAFDLKLNGNDKNRLFIPLETDILSVTSILINCVELDSSWWTYDINSVFLDPCIATSAWGSNAILDGDFYTWTVAAPTTDLYYWIETIAGTSTINRDTAQVQVGNYCVRLDIDALESTAQIRQRVSLLRNRDYNLVFKYLNSAAAKTAKFMLYNEDLNVSLQADGTWAAGQVYISLTNVVAWTDYSLEFTSHADFAGYDLYLENDVAFSSSIYFDNVGILTAGIAAIAADVSTGIFPRGFNNIQIIGTHGESSIPEAIKQAGIILAEWENDPAAAAAAGLFKSEKIGDYSYTNIIVAEEDVLTGVDKADLLLRHFIKRKAILMAP
jgi:hypothetical protein